MDAYERQKARQRERYATDPEYRARQKERHREWAQRNKERIRNYRSNHPVTCEYQSAYYYRHREEILAKLKAKRELKKQGKI